MRKFCVSVTVFLVSMGGFAGCKGGGSPAIQTGGASGTSSTSTVGGRAGDPVSGGGSGGHAGVVGMGGTGAGGSSGMVRGGSGPSGGSGGGAGPGGSSGSGGTGGVGGNGTGGIGGGPACPVGQTMCGSVCVHKATNPAHCGMCDNVCGGSQTCVDGQCGNTPQWDTPFRIGTAGELAFDYSIQPSTESRIQAAADSQGNVFVAWPWDAGNGTKLWVNRYDGTQGTWSGPVEVDSGVTDTLQPFLAAHANGDATLIYRKRLNNGVVPYAKRYQRSRGTWDASATVLCNGCEIRRRTRDYNGTTNFAENLNAAGSENGDVAVVWDSPAIPFVNVFDHATGTWSGEFRNIDDQIEVSLNDEIKDVRLSIDRSGNATMIRLSRFQFYFNRYDASTKSWTAHARVPVGAQSLPVPNDNYYHLCQNPKGDVALLWRDATARKVVATVFSSALSSWPAEPRVAVSLGNGQSLTTNSYLVQHRCALTPDGSVVMGINDSNVRLLGVRLSASAAIGDTVFPIVTTTVATRGEMAESDPSGNVVVVSNLGSARYDAKLGAWSVLNNVGQPVNDVPNSLVFDVRGRALRVSTRLVPSSQDPNKNWTEVWGQWLR
jgi:hypothetical protein